MAAAPSEGCFPAVVVILLAAAYLPLRQLGGIWTGVSMPVLLSSYEFLGNGPFSNVGPQKNTWRRNHTDQMSPAQIGCDWILMCQKSKVIHICSPFETIWPPSADAGDLPQLRFVGTMLLTKVFTKKFLTQECGRSMLEPIKGLWRLGPVRCWPVPCWSTHVPS